MSTCVGGSATTRAPATVRGHTDRPTEVHRGGGSGEWKTKQGSPVANGDLWQDLQALLRERQAPTEWIKVPSHVGRHGSEMADRLADLGKRLHGVRMQGQEPPAPKRQAGWARDKWGPGAGEPGASTNEGGTGRSAQCSTRASVCTYVNLGDQRRDLGHRCAVFFANRTEALALRSAEEKDRRQLVLCKHCVRRQGLQGL